MSGFLEYFLLHLQIILVLALTVSLAGISYIENVDAASGHNFESQWGKAGISKSGFFLSPQHLAFDSENNVYVTDLGNSRVQKFDSDGTLDDGGGTTLDAANDVRIADYGILSKDDLAGLGPAGTGSHYIAASDASGTVSTIGDISLQDITNAMELIGAKGLNADTVMISPSHYKTLLNLADFTAPFASTSLTSGAKGGLDYVNDVAKSGVVGQLYGLNVVMNPYIPNNRFGVFDMSVKPMAYVERRGLTVEEANPGFGITGSYMSMRYGLKIIRPEAGVIVIGD